MTDYLAPPILATKRGAWKPTRKPKDQKTKKRKTYNQAGKSSPPSKTKRDHDGASEGLRGSSLQQSEDVVDRPPIEAVARLIT